MIAGSLIIRVYYCSLCIFEELIDHSCSWAFWLWYEKKLLMWQSWIPNKQPHSSVLKQVLSTANGLLSEWFIKSIRDQAPWWSAGPSVRGVQDFTIRNFTCRICPGKVGWAFVHPILFYCVWNLRCGDGGRVSPSAQPWGDEELKQIYNMVAKIFLHLGNTQTLVCVTVRQFLMKGE